MTETEQISIIWIDSQTGEEKEIYDFRTTLAGLWNINQYVKNEFKKTTGSKQTDITADTLENIEQIKKAAVALALAQNDWNKKKTAEKLGIQRTTLHEITERWKLSKEANLHTRLTPHYIQSMIGEISKDLLRAEAVLIANEIIKEQLREIHGKVSDAVAGQDDI